LTCLSPGRSACGGWAGPAACQAAAGWVNVGGAARRARSWRVGRQRQRPRTRLDQLDQVVTLHWLAGLVVLAHEHAAHDRTDQHVQSLRSAWDRGGGGGLAHAAGCGQVGKPPALAAAAAAARQQRATMHLSRPGAVGPCCSSLLLALILRDLHAESRGSKFGRPPMHRCPRPQVAGGQPATSCSMAMLARALSCRALSSCLSICTRSTTGARPDGPPPSPVSSDSRPAAHHALSVGRQASGRRERARHGTHDWTRASCRVWRAAVADGPHPRRNAWGVRSCVCRRPRRQRTWWL